MTDRSGGQILEDGAGGGTTSRFLLSFPINASLGCVCFGFGRLAIMFSVINNDYGGGLFAIKVIVVI